MLTASPEYGRRSTERTLATSRNGKTKKSRRTSRPLMGQGAEVVELHHIEDAGHRTVMGGGEDEALWDLLDCLRLLRSLRDERIQHQYPRTRKEMPQCTLLGKPLRNERTKRWWFPSKGRKWFSETVLYTDRLLCRVLIIYDCHYPYGSIAFTSSGNACLFKMCPIYRPSKVNTATSNTSFEVKGEIRQSQRPLILSRYSGLVPDAWPKSIISITPLILTRTHSSQENRHSLS